jgi:hypothetical protein
MALSHENLATIWVSSSLEELDLCLPFYGQLEGDGQW